VVQGEPYNRSRLATVIVAVLTTNQRLAAMPGNVLLPATLTGLPEDSVVNVTQLVTVNRADLEPPVGRLPTWLMDEVDRGLRRVLGL
jgi:mRNA interferase MazF